jgi:type I restriction enzyme, S subunit
MGDSATRSVLGDYFSLQRGKTYKSRLLDQPGPVLLGLASIGRNGGFRSDSLRTYGGESPDNLLVYPGDLYVSLKDVTQSGDLLGSVARLPETCPIGRLSQDTVKLQPLSDDVPKAYLYWLMRTPQYRAYCRSHATGTTNLGLSRDDFLSFPAPEPTAEQQTVVDTLESVEQKITTNHRLNRALERMARSIFKAWFIDFEPVKARGDGATSFPGMAQDVFDQLPDQLVESELGPVPKEWPVQAVADIAEYINGRAFTKHANGQGRMIIRIAELNSGPGGATKYSDVETEPEHTAFPDDILFAWSGSLDVYRWHRDEAVINQHIFKVVPKDYPKWYGYYRLVEAMPFFQSIASTKATTMGHIKRGHLADALFAAPPAWLVDAAEVQIRPLYDLVHSNERESLALANTRDTLLPKLIGGELPLEGVGND